MGAVRFTARAEADLDAIAAYSLETWGLEQALEYLALLEACFRELADDRARGRVHRPRPEYWRFEQGKHVVFFRREEGGGVLIVRVLHHRMLPALHLDENPE